MIPHIRLAPNPDGTYDILVEYTRADVELAADFDVERNLKADSKSLSSTMRSYAKKAKIKSVKILVSGALVATIAFSAFMSALAKGDRYIMGYLYSGTDLQQIEFVNQAGEALDTVSPSYFDLREDGSLKLNYLSPYFIKNMHSKGIKVVPFLSNHWNRTAGIAALKNVDSLSTQIADYVEEYDLDGVNVDIENVTHEQRDAYTQLVRLLREKIPSHKEVSVAVAANPNNWQTGWHGSYDYAALAQYADHLMIMAYDEHYEGGEAGPVASIDFVENSIRYALSKTTADKIVVGVPFYGRVWSLDNNRIVGKGTSTKTIQQILENCESTVTYDRESQSVKAEFVITESSGSFTVGSGVVLQPGRYVAWFENDRSYQAKLSLIEKYNLKGAGAWSLGQEDTSIWENYEDWVNGEDADTEESAPPAPSVPEQPAPSEPETDGTTTTTPSVPETGGSTATTPTGPEAGGTTSPAPSVPESDGSTATTPTVPEAGGPTVLPPTVPETGGTTATTPTDPENGDSTTAPPAGPETSAPVTKPSESQPVNAWVKENVSKAEVYKNPNLKGKVVASLSEGEAVSVLEDLGNGVYRVKLDGGQTGYMASACLTFQEPDLSEPLPPSQEYWVYEVRRGDSLWKIADRYLGAGSRYREIMELNGLTSDRLLPGMQLKIPGEAYREYTVKRGDSLWKIAQNQLGSGTRYTEIMELNGLSSDLIHPGQVLKLPR